MFFLQVLHSPQGFPIVIGISQWPAILDPLQLVLHITAVLVELERVLQLLVPIQHWLCQLREPAKRAIMKVKLCRTLLHEGNIESETMYNPAARGQH